MQSLKYLKQQGSHRPIVHNKFKGFHTFIAYYTVRKQIWQHSQQQNLATQPENDPHQTWRVGAHDGLEVIFSGNRR